MWETHKCSISILQTLQLCVVLCQTVPEAKRQRFSTFSHLRQDHSIFRDIRGNIQHKPRLQWALDPHLPSSKAPTDRPILRISSTKRARCEKRIWTCMLSTCSSVTWYAVPCRSKDMARWKNFVVLWDFLLKGKSLQNYGLSRGFPFDTGQNTNTRTTRRTRTVNNALLPAGVSHFWRWRCDFLHVCRISFLEGIACLHTRTESKGQKTRMLRQHRAWFHAVVSSSWEYTQQVRLFFSLATFNKKQCSRQLQCEVPCR